MYYSVTEKRTVIILVYVDDYLIATDDPTYYNDFIANFKSFLGANKVNDLGTPRNLLQMKIDVSNDRIEVSQVKHIEKCIERFGLGKADCSRTMIPMDESESLRKAETPDMSLPYREIVGSLLWIARCTRPDIMHAVAYLGQFSCHYNKSHFTAA